MRGSPDASAARTGFRAPPFETPSSDAGEIEEARAALLGDRYWAQVSTPAYALRPGVSNGAGLVREEPSEDEVSHSNSHSTVSGDKPTEMRN